MPRAGQRLNHKSTCHPDRPHYAKGMCRYCYITWMCKNVPYWRERARQRKWSSHLQIKYKLSMSQYNALINKSEGRCMLCGKQAKKFHIDHNHETGQVRGLLCARCNSGLGYIEDGNFVELSRVYLGGRSLFLGLARGLKHPIL